jgi:hypothetical protein
MQYAAARSVIVIDCRNITPNDAMGHFNKRWDGFFKGAHSFLTNHDEYKAYSTLPVAWSNLPVSARR